MYKVLIADDNKQIVSILSEYCKKNNFTVSTVFDGEEALKRMGLMYAGKCVLFQMFQL